MNTPAHGIINLIVLDHSKGSKSLTLPIALGAILPDAPILLFYFIQKFILSKPDALIWSVIYDRPAWQLSVDIVNSLPLIIVALIVSAWMKHPWLTALFASMGLHSLADLPFHGMEALRHLLPFNHWQFENCISYNEPAIGGWWYFFAEIALVILGSALLLRRKALPPRIACALFTSAYALCMAYAWLN